MLPVFFFRIEHIFCISVSDPLALQCGVGSSPTTTDFNILQNPYFAGPAQSGTSAFYLEDPDPEDLPSINIESGTLDLTFSIC